MKVTSINMDLKYWEIKLLTFIKYDFKAIIPIYYFPCLTEEYFAKVEITFLLMYRSSMLFGGAGFFV